VSIEIASRRRALASIAAQWPGATVLDVTSKGSEPWVRLSPFYPHGDIPVPMTPGRTAQSVEGIWQSLKVFENADVDATKLDITSMKGIKRTSRRYGRVLGHRNGLTGDTLLSYEHARRRIYLPAYRWMLENKTTDLLIELVKLGGTNQIILLDYTVNANVDDLSRPLSHAALICRYVEGRWPAES